MTPALGIQFNFCVIEKGNMGGYMAVNDVCYRFEVTSLLLSSFPSNSNNTSSSALI